MVVASLTESYWTVVRVKTNRERYAHDNIRKQHHECYCPLFQPEPYRPDRVRPLFAGYVFALIDLTNWWFLKGTYGVLNVIFTDGYPARIPDAVLRDLRKRERNGLVQPLPGFSIGQKLKVKAGPLLGQIGTLTRMVRSDHLELLLPMFGAERHVTLKTGWCQPS